MQVEFEKNDHISVKLFSASFHYTIPIDYKNANIDIWRSLADSDTKSITIFLSHIMNLSSSDSHDTQLIEKHENMIKFLSPIRGIPEDLKSGGETRIPFQYCQDAFKKIVDYLESL